MKHLLLGLFLVPMALLMGSCRGTMTPGTLSVLREGGRQYALFVPEAIRTLPPGSRLPVVMYLHGYTENPFLNEPWIVRELQKKEPCVVFIPFADPDESASAWGGTYETELRPAMKESLAILDDLLARYPLDAGRQYLYGGSMGGEGVLLLLATYPDRFAAAVVGGGYTVNRSAAEMARTPLWLLHGSADTVADPGAIRTIYREILANGGSQVRYTEFPGLDHGTLWEAIKKTEGLLGWLLSFRKP